MKLSDAVAAWNGKDRATIDAVYQTHKTDPDLLQSLLNLCQQADTERGASWLLKAAYDDGNQPDKTESTLFYQALMNAHYWETRLHLLQVLHRVPLTTTQQAEVYQWLTHQLHNPNKFIRAWVYHGLHHVAEWYPQYRNEVDTFIKLALQDEAPSVQARLRKLTKQQ